MKRIKGIRKIYLMVLFLGAFMSKGVLEKHNITQNIVKATEAGRPEDNVVLSGLNKPVRLEFKDFKLGRFDSSFAGYEVELKGGIIGFIKEVLEEEYTSTLKRLVDDNGGIGGGYTFSNVSEDLEKSRDDTLKNIYRSLSKVSPVLIKLSKAKYKFRQSELMQLVLDIVNLKSYNYNLIGTIAEAG